MASTHRYLIQPLAGEIPMKIKRIIIGEKTSTKPVLRQVYDIAKKDVWTTTGCNLRNILLLTDLTKVEDLDSNIINSIKYQEIREEDMWRVNLIKELLDMKHGKLDPPEGWTQEDLDNVLNFTCTQ